MHSHESHNFWGRVGPGAGTAIAGGARDRRLHPRRHPARRPSERKIRQLSSHAGNGGVNVRATNQAAVLLAFAALLLCAARAVVAADAQRPNILLIYCDDHAYQAVSAYGLG